MKWYPLPKYDNCSLKPWFCLINRCIYIFTTDSVTKHLKKYIYCQHEISVNNRYAKLNKTYDTPALSLIT